MNPVLKIGDLLPDIALRVSDGRRICRIELGVTVVYGYPRTSPPNSAPIEGWDQIPWARGCTPQSCAFRHHHSDLLNLGAAQVSGLSPQTSEHRSQITKSTVSTNACPEIGTRNKRQELARQTHTW